MNFISLIIYSYLLGAAGLIFLLIKEIKQDKRPLNRLARLPKKFFERLTHRHEAFYLRHEITMAKIMVVVLGLGMVLAVDARFIEPWLINVKPIEVSVARLNRKIKIAWLTDLQVGNHKKNDWLEKIVDETIAAAPDIVLLGGDLVDNAGQEENESQYLEPLKKLAGRQPIFYLMGNHEYGIVSNKNNHPDFRSADVSAEVAAKMAELGIPPLRDELVCLEIKKQKICVFGADDFWKKTIDFSALEKADPEAPLILAAHNPDAIRFWPTGERPPDLTLGGHTHGGQIWFPLLGPLGNGDIELGEKYYRGLNEYRGAPIYVSIGLGESGGPLRLFSPPELAIVTLRPKK